MYYRTNCCVFISTVFRSKAWHKSKKNFASSFLQFCKKKIENLWLINCHFTTIFGYFFASYMKIFHKTEVQTNILRCIVCLNPNWKKSYDMIFFFNLKAFNKLLRRNYDNCSEYYKIIRKMIEKLGFKLILILVKKKIHAWKCIISGQVCRSDFWHLLWKSALIFLKWIFFKISLMLSWPT